jgi:hypothetical protein
MKINYPENISKWEIIRNYINSNEIIERKIIDKGGSTIDNYINMLINCEFIERINRGKYKRKCTIPDMTSSMLQEIAYDKEKRIRFIRKIKLEKLIH